MPLKERWLARVKSFEKQTVRALPLCSPNACGHVARADVQENQPYNELIARGLASFKEDLNKDLALFETEASNFRTHLLQARDVFCSYLVSRGRIRADCRQSQSRFRTERAGADVASLGKVRAWQAKVALAFISFKVKLLPAVCTVETE